MLGYSFGGLVAQYLARRAPTRVRRLVLAATTPGWGGVPGSMWTLSQMATLVAGLAEVSVTHGAG